MNIFELSSFESSETFRLPLKRLSFIFPSSVLDIFLLEWLQREIHLFGQSVPEIDLKSIDSPETFALFLSQSPVQSLYTQVLQFPFPQGTHDPKQDSTEINISPNCQTTSCLLIKMLEMSNLSSGYISNLTLIR